jgi:ABC-type multidrug transport system fused ATPase/permease subunit
VIQFHKLLSILEPAQRRSALGLLCLMFIGTVLETLGIGLVIPALALMTRKDLLQSPSLTPLIAALGNPNQTELIILGMFALVAIYLIKTGFLIFLDWKQVKFVFGLQASLSEKLFTGYLNHTYSFHLQKNSAQLINNVLTETTNFTFGTIIPTVTLIAESLVFAGLACLLLIVEPVGALVTFCALGVTGWCFHYFTSRKLVHWGKVRQEHEGLRLQHLQQGFGSVKDVKLLGRENEFIKVYAFHNNETAHMMQHKAFVQDLPRLGLDLLAIVGLAILVINLLHEGKAPAMLIPTVGLFAAATFRFIPSVHRILHSIQSLRYSLPIITTLDAEIRNFPPPLTLKTTSRIRFERELELRQVSYSYSEGTPNIIDEVDLKVPQGTSLGLIGGSGAGKSTLVDIVLGLLDPTDGNVLVDGVDIRQNLRGWQNQIGYVPQNIYLTDDSLRRNIAFGLPEEEINESSVLAAINAARLRELVDSLPDGLNTAVGERGVRLSGGQKQRIGIARALYNDPAVLVLDEATSALDTLTEQEVMKAVNDLRGTKTLIIIAHRLSTLNSCDCIYEIERGKLSRKNGPITSLK